MAYTSCVVMGSMVARMSSARCSPHRCSSITHLRSPPSAQHTSGLDSRRRRSAIVWNCSR
eukprot:6824884-Pyramimonas_sp.AAC.2